MNESDDILVFQPHMPSYFLCLENLIRHPELLLPSFQLRQFFRLQNQSSTYIFELIFISNNSPKDLLELIDGQIITTCPVDFFRSYCFG